MRNVLSIYSSFLLLFSPLQAANTCPFHCCFVFFAVHTSVFGNFLFRKTISQIRLSYHHCLTLLALGIVTNMEQDSCCVCSIESPSLLECSGTTESSSPVLMGSGSPAAVSISFFSLQLVGKMLLRCRHVQS